MDFVGAQPHFPGQEGGVNELPGLWRFKEVFVGFSNEPKPPFPGRKGGVGFTSFLLSALLKRFWSVLGLNPNLVFLNPRP